MAEEAKVIENTQRDLNIALMNELAIIFDRIGIETLEVLQAAGTNGIPRRSGPAGGRPLNRRRPILFDAQGGNAGLPPARDPGRAPHQRRHGQVRGGKNHQGNGRAGFKLKGSHVNVLADLQGKLPGPAQLESGRQSNELQSYGVQGHVHDPVSRYREALEEYGLLLESWEQLPQAEAIISASRTRPCWPSDGDFQAKVLENGCFIDIKSHFDPRPLEDGGLHVWRL